MELRIEHISKQFKDKIAVDDVSFTLTPGVWGLLGANGAGKTTLMRMIADIMEPTSGTIFYDGQEIKKMGEDYRNLFGFLPQEFGYSRDFTVKDYLEYMAAFPCLMPVQLPVSVTRFIVQHRITKLLKSTLFVKLPAIRFHILTSFLVGKLVVLPPFRGAIRRF